MGFFGKLSLFLTVLFFPYMMPSASKMGECDWKAWADAIQNFGSNGIDGKDGTKGEDGRSAEQITIFADGSPQTLNLAGQDGARGQDGQNGEDAKCGAQPQQVEYNLKASSGGNGGNGGDGGDGGNGGNLTIYGTNLMNLRSITVNGIGGTGGQPGNGGRGGKGCNCTVPYWTRETCQGNPGDANYRCTTRQFRCENGSNGINGVGGRIGRDGNLTKLTLINLNRPLTDDKPSATVALSELKERGFTLSKNKWETRNGAVSLFAPGSILEDQYRVLVERQEESFLLIWNAPQSFAKFAQQRFTLTMDEEQGIQVDIPQDLWLEATTQRKGNLTELIVYNGILEREATQLKSQGISGNRQDLQLTLVDEANLSNLIATTFNVKYSVTRNDPRFRPVSDYRTRYQGEMPADLITLNGSKFTLNLGKLPIDEEYLKPGWGVEIIITANRTFGSYSQQQRITIQDLIPGLK